MDRVFESGAAVGAPAAPASPSNGYATAGNPATATPATKPGPYWYHMITESLRKLVVDAGLTPDHTNLSLVSQAVQSMIAAGAANDYKASVRAATTANIASLAGGAPNTLDGVTLAANDRILVKDQTTGSQNGIYVVTTLGTGANGTWSRATDADQAGELTSGAIVSVEEGTVNFDSQWMLTTDGAITIGTTVLTWAPKTGSVASVSSPPAVRQTVLSGPVDTNGLPNFGGSTGGTSVTMAGTIVATAANGNSNLTGSGTNLQWTGITANSFATVTVNQNGSLTPNLRTLAPIYQWGGTPSVTNGQLTFNIQEMKMYLGNGTVANQVNEVVVGEFAAAGTVSAITWYALMGRYRSPVNSPLVSTPTVLNFNHNLGINTEAILGGFRFFAQNITSENNWPAGSIIEPDATANAGGLGSGSRGVISRNSASATPGSNGTGWQFVDRSTGGSFQLTVNRWGYFATVSRGW